MCLDFPESIASAMEFNFSSSQVARSTKTFATCRFGQAQIIA
jgi:hypothetical protein